MFTNRLLNFLKDGGTKGKSSPMFAVSSSVHLRVLPDIGHFGVGSMLFKANGMKKRTKMLVDDDGLQMLTVSFMTVSFSLGMQIDECV
jgi:hypothetical protein